MNRPLVAALLGALWAAAATETRAQRGPLGAHVQVTATSSVVRLRGELLAVSPDSLWLLRDGGLVTVPLPNVVQVQVKRQPMGAGGIMAWGLIGGTISGLALTAACATLDDNSDCGGVFSVVLLTWSLWSGIWADVAGSGYRSYRREQIQIGVSPYARFPQGLPQGFALQRRSQPPPDTASVRSP